MNNRNNDKQNDEREIEDEEPQDEEMNRENPFDEDGIDEDGESSDTDSMIWNRPPPKKTQKYTSNDDEEDDEPSSSFVKGNVQRESDKAVMVNDEWYPKSRIQIVQGGIMVENWLLKKKSSAPKKVESPDNKFNGRIVERREKAILVEVTLDGKKGNLWFPLSQVKIVEGGITVATWLYAKKVEELKNLKK